MKIHVGVLWIVFLILTLFGCNSLPTEEIAENLAPMRIIDFDYPSDYDLVQALWFPDGSLVAILDQIVGGSGNEIPYMVEGKEGIQLLSLDNDTNCELTTFYRLLFLLPDRRLGVIKDCIKGSTSSSYLLAYDFAIKSLDPLVKKPLPPDTPIFYSWDQTLSLGVQSFGSLNGTIYWITSDGPEPMNIILEHEGESFSLAESYNQSVNSEPFSATGVARQAQISLDGTAVVFLANFDAIGREGMLRTQGEWLLFRMDIESGRVVELLNDLYDPAALRWSPNGEWLAYSGKIGDQEGLWLISQLDGKIELIYSQKKLYLDVTWSSDSTKLLAITCGASLDECVNPDNREVLEFQIDGH